MKILLIGNFAPPYEEESLHNLTLLKRLREEGNDCLVINISANPSREDEFINVKGYFDFVFKLIRYSWKKDIIHYLTKSYTRMALLKFSTSILISNIFLAKSIVTLHSEMFSIFAQSRGPTGGRQLIYATFHMAHKVIFGGKDTYDIASTYYKARNNFEIIPCFIHIPEDIRENEQLFLKKLQNKKNVIVFSNVIYPSLLFDVLNSMLAKYFNPDMGMAVSFAEKLPAKLQHVIEEAGRLSENIVFIEPDNARLLSLAYAKADLILRPMTCDGKPFFEDFALIVRETEHSKNYLYFPTSLLLIKEGDVSDLCAYILNQLLSEKREIPTGSLTEDFYAKIKKIYNESTTSNRCYTLPYF
jgi:hypothetical protein